MTNGERLRIVFEHYLNSKGWQNRLYFRDLINLDNRNIRTLSIVAHNFADDLSELNQCKHENYTEEHLRRECKECGAVSFGEQQNEEPMCMYDSQVVWQGWK